MQKFGVVTKICEHHKCIYIRKPLLNYSYLLKIEHCNGQVTLIKKTFLKWIKFGIMKMVTLRNDNFFIRKINTGLSTQYNRQISDTYLPLITYSWRLMSLITIYHVRFQKSYLFYWTDNIIVNN